MHNVLVIAEKQRFGACLEEVLQGYGCHVTVVESHGGQISDAFQDTTGRYFGLVIATNTSLPPAHLQKLIPEIKLLHRHARILVLSGYCPEGFVADLREKGIDAFLPLPYQEETLLIEVAWLLSRPKP